MRRIASFLLLGVALAAGAADIWRWKDADGVVHYSDSPVPGAERITVSGSAPQPAATPAEQADAAWAEAPAVTPKPPERYTRCAVVQPKNDESFFAVDSVGVNLVIEPYLQPNHRIQVLLNGAPEPNWPEAAQSYTFTGLFRGSYTLTVRVVDASGRAVCSGPVSNFHIRQPSIFSPQSPQRPPAPKN